MVIKQTVKCPHCGSEYGSRIELAADQVAAQEQCNHCRRMIYFRIQTDDTGQLGGIEIHPRKL